MNNVKLGVFPQGTGDRAHPVPVSVASGTPLTARTLSFRIALPEALSGAAIALEKAAHIQSAIEAITGIAAGDIAIDISLAGIGTHASAERAPMHVWSEPAGAADKPIEVEVAPRIPSGPDIRNLPDTSFVRFHEVAAILRVSRSSLRKMVERGQIPPPIRLSLRLVGWHAKDVRQFMLTV